MGLSPIIIGFHSGSASKVTASMATMESINNNAHMEQTGTLEDSPNAFVTSVKLLAHPSKDKL